MSRILFRPCLGVGLENTVNDFELRKSDRLLDIACGTGIVGRMARSRDVKNLHVIGCDVNDAMLQVAKEIEPGITWVKGNAQDLPFADRSFDKISFQFGLMFIQDRVKAINEMIRVGKDQGKIIIAI
ncbi:MAG: methyltransferase domain-containing protein [Saprospiraceae bacterium]|nr:methyltransferase domain-containing protein [Saprospiraceae bacterium]